MCVPAATGKTIGMTARPKDQAMPAPIATVKTDMLKLAITGIATLAVSAISATDPKIKETEMPLHSFPFALFIMAASAGGLLWYFYRKGWLSSDGGSPRRD